MQHPPAPESKRPAETVWPTQVDYQDALNFPASCFVDPELRECQPGDKTTFGLPLPITGQFTNVYRMVRADGAAFAVRLFLRDDPTRAYHWLTLSRFLGGLSPFPACLTPVVYLDQGFYWRGRYFPLVKLPWVDGVPLNIYIEKNLYDSAAIVRLTETFRSLILQLESIRFVHGDLQHGNILVNENTGAITLIDYDAVFVPEMRRILNREAGHPSYQHPGRSPSDYGPVLDRFSTLVIYTALRVLAIAPDLWFRLDNGDNLLFQSEDFLMPVQSRTFALLRESLRAYPVERQLVTVVQRSCGVPPTSAPPLDRL